MESVADALRKEGWLEGKKEGIKEGIEKGIIEGIKKDRIQIALKMISNRMSDETISKITGFPSEMIDKLRNGDTEK